MDIIPTCRECVYSTRNSLDDFKCLLTEKVMVSLSGKSCDYFISDHDTSCHNCLNQGICKDFHRIGGDMCVDLRQEND